MWLEILKLLFAFWEKIINNIWRVKNDFVKIFTFFNTLTAANTSYISLPTDQKIWKPDTFFRWPNVPTWVCDFWNMNLTSSWYIQYFCTKYHIQEWGLWQETLDSSRQFLHTALPRWHGADKHKVKFIWSQGCSMCQILNDTIFDRYQYFAKLSIYRLIDRTPLLLWHPYIQKAG